MKINGFIGILPGIESWFEMGNKSKIGRRSGREKLQRIAEHVNLILQYIPYVQTNIVLGLDSDQSEAAFALSREFVELVPGVFPVFALLTAFGRAAPLNLQYQEEGRVLPLPFHFLNTFDGTNVRPKHYSWPIFYNNVINLIDHAFSRKAIINRFLHNRGLTVRTANFLRSAFRAGSKRIKYLKEVQKQHFGRLLQMAP